VPALTPIDWRKPGLRLGYLVEGRYAAHDTASPFDLETVRWCGPAARLGSGVSARVSVLGIPDSDRLGAWESRISGCVYDQTLGGLKQTMQAISDVTMQVALGDEDINQTSTIDSRRFLGDAAMYGRWKGHEVAVMVIDLDDVSYGQIIGNGTWDRDPTNIGPASFRMTVSIGQVIPPNTDWPMAQVPETTAYWETHSYTGTAHYPFSPTGVASPDFGINENHKGKWFGQVFGGDELYDSASGGNANGVLWREIVTYGALSGQHFAWVSPRYDQFCYDVAYEDTGGDVQFVSDTSGSTITVFNNNDPTRGPTGTCVKFSTALFSPWSRGNRAWGKVAGGNLHFNRPSGYTDIAVGDPSTGNPEIGYGAYTATAGLAVPGAALGPWENVACAVWTVFEDIIVNFLGGELHPDATSILTTYYTTPPIAGGSGWSIGAVVPLELVNRPPSMREVLADLALAIPGDVVLRQDDATQGKIRKWVLLPRPVGGESPDRIILVGDLYDSDPGRSLVQLSDPDGNYANETTFEGSQYWMDPAGGDTDKIDTKTRDSLQLISLAEQSPTGVNQVISDEVKLKYWKFTVDTGVIDWGPVLDATKSRPQRVIEAKHGHPSMELELGDLIAYAIPGVYAGTGQVRGLLLDLDSQVVTVKTYHEPPDAERTHDGSGTEKSKERLEAEKDIPERAGKASRRGHD